MRPQGDCLCGRNWAEDPIQGNSDLWVITSNVLRRRAVSGCLFDSISCTQSSATHSLPLNCPICFHHDAQLSAAVSTKCCNKGETHTTQVGRLLSILQALHNSHFQPPHAPPTTHAHTSKFACELSHSGPVHFVQ